MYDGWMDEGRMYCGRENGLFIGSLDGGWMEDGWIDKQMIEVGRDGQMGRWIERCRIDG